MLVHLPNHPRNPHLPAILLHKDQPAGENAPGQQPGATDKGKKDENVVDAEFEEEK